MKSEDIANLAGVSRSTVSRVVNNYSNVPPETRQKVLKVIEEHKYVPNISARALAGKGTDTLGLFIVSVADRDNPNRIQQNNYFATFVDAVLDVANTMGYYVLIHTIYKDSDYSKIRQAIMQNRIDGGIIVGTESSVDFADDLCTADSPFVLVDCDLEELSSNKRRKSHLAVVNAMDYEGTESAVNYLIGLGHTEIGILLGRMNTYSGRQRYLACRNVLREKGIALHEDFVLKGEFLKKAAYYEVKRLIKLRKLPSALFCCNDEMALAAMEAFREEGIRVPADISIIGFDDIPMASQVQPALTSVRVPICEMGRKAVELVASAIEGKESAFSLHSFPTRLMKRESCRSRN